MLGPHGVGDDSGRPNAVLNSDHARGRTGQGPDGGQEAHHGIDLGGHDDEVGMPSQFPQQLTRILMGDGLGDLGQDRAPGPAAGCAAHRTIHPVIANESDAAGIQSLKGASVHEEGDARPGIDQARTQPSADASRTDDHNRR